MDRTTRTHLNNIHSTNKSLQNEAYTYLMEVTDKPVDWAYEAWDELLETLSDKDNRKRAIASQVLCNLAKSDPDNRMLKDIDALLLVTKDERFVTARHCLQSMWKIGTAGNQQQQKLLERFESRFRGCMPEKNCTLIRYDIIQGLKNLYNEVHDETIKQKALELIETEMDPKYRKKYMTIWKD
jgi:hypothetical protein